MDLKNIEVSLEISVEPFGFGNEPNATLLITGKANEVNNIANWIMGLVDTTGFYEIEKVIYNPPATIVLWKDKTKTIVKCHEDDVYDKEIGLLKCIVKKAYGNNGKYNDVIREFVNDSENKPINAGITLKMFDEAVLKSKLLSDALSKIIDDLE